MKNRILALLFYSKYVLTSDEISYVIGSDKDELCVSLLELQDSDLVYLKNGFYRLSEKSKRIYNET